MLVADGLSLDRVGFTPLAVGVSQWTVFDRNFAWDSPNPASTGRFAWPDGRHAMLYAASTPLGAFWETAGRWSRIRPALITGGRPTVYVPSSAIAGKSIVEIRLVRSGYAVDVCHGKRAQVVNQNSDLDTAWAHLLAAPTYERSHATTVRLCQQIEAEGDAHCPTLSALIWPSRRLTGAVVTLYFDPPFGPGSWEQAGDPPLALDSATGVARLAQWYAAAGFDWIDKPSFDAEPEDD
jgi:hypothetical protein